MARFMAFIRKEKVLCIAFLAAAVSCFFVLPDKEYLSYCDWRTLALLFCLMSVVGEIRKAGAFDRLAQALCSRSGNVRLLVCILVYLCFFTAMFITNDVALLTFVPFAVTVLVLAKQEKYLIRTVVLQTVAANLGSMLTPVGNPQNIYIQSYYGLGTGEFFSVTAPVWGVSLVLVGLFCLTVKGEPISVTVEGVKPVEKKKLTLGLLLFAVCLLTVLRVLPWPVMLGVVSVALLIGDRNVLKETDYCLLLTFVCFFVFSGNLSRMDSVNTFLRGVLSGREYFVSLGVSQIISNVPAALLLSGFTDNAKALLMGVNVGGLGTPIASLASLIGLKLYAKAPSASTGKFLGEFLLVNVLLLALLTGLVYFMM